MTAEVDAALTLWGWQGSEARLAARRENTVWRVTRGGADYALRFHRPGYRSASELRSELEWMAALAEAGLTVPRPVPRADGTLIGHVGAQAISLLTWLPGRPLGALSALHDIADVPGLCLRMGALMARLHAVSDAWARPEGFTRPDWRRAGLLGETPVWGRFWEHPHLDATQSALLCAARDAGDTHLAALEAGADQGLIHADLLPENVLIDGEDLALIDFDDGAFGFRDFELATFLMKFHDRPDYPEMRAALCEGYAARRAVRAPDLDLFILLRALTYPGWIAARLDEPGAPDRSARAIDTALRHATIYLDGRPT